jgi:carbamoyl-phosphate synthase large subunit
LTNEQKEAIHAILVKIGEALKFENCPSHTELKITDKGIVVIETSPRLGGDYITSTLVPLSSGINMEDQLLRISLGEMVDISSGRFSRASGVCFLNLPSGRVKAISNSIREVNKWPGVVEFSFSFKEGDEIHPITSSLNRYGQFIVQANDYKNLDSILSEYEARILDMINVE